MTLELFANFAKGLLASSIDAVTTSIPLTDAAAFAYLLASPQGQSRIGIDNEVMLATSLTVNTLTVVRGYEASTAATHTAGAIVKNVFTSGLMEQLWGTGIVSDVSGAVNWPTNTDGTRRKDFVLFQASQAAVTVSIDPSTLIPWQEYSFYDGAKVAENVALILQPLSGLIGGQAFYQLSSAGQTVNFKTDGTNLWIK